MIKHTDGTKSNAVYWKEETVKNGRSQSHGDIFIRTHQKKDKTPYDDTCKAIIAQKKDIQTQHPKSRSSIASDDDLGRIFGAEKRGRVRMLEPGPTPSRLFGSPSGGGMWQEKAASLERANEQLNDEVTRMSARQSKMERQIATLLSHFQGVESSNHVPPTSSQGDEILVTLMSIRRAGVRVARGVRMSVDPLHVVDDEPLGEFFTEV
ncbi:uncharacterized protein LOC143886618 isoform X2 [Tasmannia lanceolata]|uniref:uncharacterized protein LOC143886618 isoform X2 n=1 Tax=Tasmannia lanceolata TaxID=3420 RepID=UPI0040634C2B